MTWQLLILEKEPPIILRWPQKCSQVTGKTLKGRNTRVIFEEQWLKRFHIVSPKSDFRITIVCQSV